MKKEFNDDYLDALESENSLLEKKINKRRRTDCYVNILIYSLGLIFLVGIALGFFITSQYTPKFQTQGIVEDVFMKNNEPVYVINAQNYNMKDNLIVGIDIPTSVRLGDLVSIYELYGKFFSVKPSLEYEKICEAKIDSGRPVGGLIFSFFSIVFATLIFFNIKRLKGSKKSHNH